MSEPAWIILSLAVLAAVAVGALGGVLLGAVAFRRAIRPAAVRIRNARRFEDGTWLFNLHPPEKCAGEPCCIHNPSAHRLASRSLNWRGPLVGMERICEHGIGHPDPDDMQYRRRAGLQVNSVHGCDGCCYEPPADDEAIENTEGDTE